MFTYSNLIIIWSALLKEVSNEHHIILLQVGKNVDKWLGLLSARRVFPFGMGDENVANSKHGGKNIL